MSIRRSGYRRQRPASKSDVSRADVIWNALVKVGVCIAIGSVIFALVRYYRRTERHVTVVQEADRCWIFKGRNEPNFSAGVNRDMIKFQEDDGRLVVLLREHSRWSTFSNDAEMRAYLNVDNCTIITKDQSDVD